jgi:hypothetical protein
MAQWKIPHVDDCVSLQVLHHNQHHRWQCHQKADQERLQQMRVQQAEIQMIL